MIRIGKVVATHGLQGAIILKHIIDKSNWMNAGDVLFIELRKDSHIPFFVQETKAINDEEYITILEDTTTAESAKKLIGKHVYVKEDILKGHAGDSPLLWIGFNLVDKTKRGLGQIEDVMQTGAQWLAKLNYMDKEVLIPLVQDFIIEVNVRNKFVRVDLPEGLVEIYTQS